MIEMKEEEAHEMDRRQSHSCGARGREEGRRKDYDKEKWGGEECCGWG